MTEKENLKSNSDDICNQILVRAAGFSRVGHAPEDLQMFQEGQTPGLQYTLTLYVLATNHKVILETWLRCQM